MSNAEQAPKTYSLKILKGEDKGAQFKLVNKSIRIGRGTDNDVVLKDPKCSRNHALITITSGTILIEDLESQTGIEVDGVKAPKSFLTPGSIIVIGTSQIKFEEYVSKSVATIDEVKKPSWAPETVQNNPLGVKSFGGQKNQGNNKAVFYIVILLVAGVMGWLLMDNNQKQNGPSLLSDEDVDKSIESSKNKQEEIIKAQTLSGKNTRQYLEAQSTFLKGLRDYREGHYKRAAESFSATLAIYPQHELGHRYLELANNKHLELVQYTFNEATKFLEQNKYKEAQAGFQSVMVLIGNPNDKQYQQAKEKFQESTLLLNEVN